MRGDWLENRQQQQQQQYPPPPPHNSMCRQVRPNVQMGYNSSMSIPMQSQVNPNFYNQGGMISPQMGYNNPQMQQQQQLVGFNQPSSIININMKGGLSAPNYPNPNYLPMKQNPNGGMMCSQPPPQSQSQQGFHQQKQHVPMGALSNDISIDQMLNIDE